jgi:hypothetical protein
MGKINTFVSMTVQKKLSKPFQKSHELGIISNQPEESIEPLRSANILSLFNRVFFPSKKIKKPHGGYFLKISI